MLGAEVASKPRPANTLCLPGLAAGKWGEPDRGYPIHDQRLLSTENGTAATRADRDTAPSSRAALGRDPRTHRDHGHCATGLRQDDPARAMATQLVAKGAFVAWATLDAEDDRARFVDLLFFALRAATGREHFSAAAAQGQLQANREIDALTTLLAEVALLATPVVIVLDDAHRMPQATLQEMLAYLLNNAPPNLQFMVGSRRSLEVDVADLFTSGRLAAIDVSDLRMSAAESLEILRARFGNRIGLDDAVHLHDLMEGWPLGLQLAASTIEPASDLHAMVGQLTARRGDLQRFFFESVLSRLTPDESAFLVRISILETINADLCEAVTGCVESARYLERLVEESPVLTEAEGRNWLRLHAMARDYLLGQFDRLPADERQACYERAAAWYARHGQHDVAARHALAAGDDTRAFDYAARCLFDIAREGRLAEANDWVKRLPASAMASDVRLQLSAAWISALGNDPASVPAMTPGLSSDTRNSARNSVCRRRSSRPWRPSSGQTGTGRRGLDCVAGALGRRCHCCSGFAGQLARDAGPAPGRQRTGASACASLVTVRQREPGMRMGLGFADLLARPESRDGWRREQGSLGTAAQVWNLPSARPAAAAPSPQCWRARCLSPFCFVASRSRRSLRLPTGWMSSSGSACQTRPCSRIGHLR